MRWIRRFVLTAVTMGGAYAVLLYLALAAGGSSVSPGFLAISGACFGFLMSAVFTSAAWLTVRKRGTDLAARVRQVREVSVPGSRAEALNLCADATRSVGRVKVRLVDPTTGVVEARKGLTWKTFGDAVRIRIVAGDDREQRVRIESRPVVPTTLVDYGSNYDTVTAITDYLARHGAVGADYPASEF
jgi:hypothetical protein